MDLIDAASVQFHRQHDIFVHIEHRNQIIVLKYKTYLPASENRQRIILQREYFPAIHLHFT